MNFENKVEPMQLEIASDSSASEALQKYAMSESEKGQLEGAKVEFMIAQNNQQLLRLCTKPFTTCPTGQHRISPCTHIVNC